MSVATASSRPRSGASARGALMLAGTLALLALGVTVLSLSAVFPPAR